jgi:hypothetical protein
VRRFGVRVADPWLPRGGQAALQPGDHLAGDAGSHRHVHLTKVSSHPNVLDHPPDLHIVTHVPRMV